MLFGVGSWLEELNNLVETELEGSLLHAALDSLFSEETLLLLKVDDALFDGILRGDLVDYHVHGLSETMYPVDGLFLDELQ